MISFAQLQNHHKEHTIEHRDEKATQNIWKAQYHHSCSPCPFPAGPMGRRFPHTRKSFHRVVAVPSKKPQSYYIFTVFSPYFAFPEYFRL